MLTQNFTNAAEADPVIVKTAPPTVIAGNTLTYTFSTTNEGPSTASDVTITDPLPSDVTYVSTTPGQGASFANGVLTVSLGNMASGATATTTVIVTVSSSASGTITNTATVRDSLGDGNSFDRQYGGDRGGEPDDCQDRLAESS